MDGRLVLEAEDDNANVVAGGDVLATVDDVEGEENDSKKVVCHQFRNGHHNELIFYSKLLYCCNIPF